MELLDEWKKKLETWKKGLEKVKDNRLDFDLHATKIYNIYESYNSMDPIYDLENLDDIKIKLGYYKKFFHITQDLRILLRDRKLMDVGNGRNQKEENRKLIEEVFNNLKEDISFLRVQILSLRQENIMNEQIRQMKNQMKVAKMILGIALTSLGVAIVYGLITIWSSIITWLGI